MCEVLILLITWMSGCQYGVSSGSDASPYEPWYTEIHGQWHWLFLDHPWGRMLTTNFNERVSDLPNDLVCAAFSAVSKR